MMNPTLILVVQSDTSSVSFLCASPVTGAELHFLGNGEDEKSFTPSVKPAIADGSGYPLSAGVHVLVGQLNLGIGCKVLSGDVTVIVPTGGEDPWPTPPPPKVQALDDDESERVEAEGESPSPTPPPPKMTEPMRAYVRRLMSTPR
jgi:hypothetical protein